MAQYDERYEAWRDNQGRIHYNQGDADAADKGIGQNSSSDNSWLGMAGGNILIFILLSLPILIAKVIGSFFGLLTRLGVVGRILQTLVMAGLLAIVAALLADMAREGELLSNVVRGPLQLALVVLPSVWYFLWHFNAMRYMGAAEFSVHFKTLCTYLYFGVLGGYIWSIFGSMATGTIIAYVVIAIGILVYIRSTKPYAQAAKEADDDTLIRSNAVKRTVMLIALAATVGLGIFMGATTAVGNAMEDSAMKEQLEKQVPGANLPVDTPYEATLKVSVKAMKMDGSGREVTIPAGTPITVSRYAHIGGVYEAYVKFEGGGSSSYCVEDLSVIQPTE